MGVIEILSFFHTDNAFIRRLQLEDITAKVNLVIKELMRSYYPYEDFKSRCPDLNDMEAGHEYALLKGYLKTTIMAYFNNKSAQIQRPLTEKAELDMHIWYFGHRVWAVDFRYLPLEKMGEY